MYKEELKENQIYKTVNKIKNQQKLMKEKDYMYRINNNLAIIDSIIETVFEENFRKKYFSKNPYDYMQREADINNSHENDDSFEEDEDFFNENQENNNSSQSKSRYSNDSKNKNK